eukprot:scaffold93409_cov79-Phaeocystis_antarctica.AAC.1
MTWPGGLGSSRGSKKCIAGGDTECCCMGRLTRLNQLKLAYFSPNIDEFSRVRVPKSGHRARLSHMGRLTRSSRVDSALKIGLFQRPTGESSRVDVPKTGPRGQG